MTASEDEFAKSVRFQDDITERVKTKTKDGKTSVVYAFPTD